MDKRPAPPRGELIKELMKIYSPLSVLSEKEDRRVILCEHRELKTKIVLRSLPERLPVYDFLCRVRQPNLPAVYDVLGACDGVVVLEEYISGVNVSEVLPTGLYTYKGAVTVLRQVCSALSVLHENRFVHRDVKPENVMIGDDGTVRLIDFDAARQFDVGKSRDTSFLGTVGFAPPEQFGVAQSDPRSDIYALGVLLNVMLTGSHPSEKLAEGKAGKVVLRSTQINPAKRFETVKEFEKNL